MIQSPAVYMLPTWAWVRWLTDAGRDVPSNLRVRFIAGFFTSIAPLVIGGIVNLSVNLVAAILHPAPAFIGLIGVESIVLVGRLSLLMVGRRAARQNRPTPTDLLVLSSLVWPGVVGIGTAMCLASGDPVLLFLAPTTMVGIVAGIATRNNGAPRFAIAQVILCDCPMQCAIPFLGHPWMMISLFQFPLFILAMYGTIHRLNRSYVAAVLAEQESEKRATQDGLTGLLNRAGLMAALARELTRAGAQTIDLSLLYIDLDGFKGVNDECGHAAGDDLLCQFARRLAECVPDAWPKSRLGGDEFVIVAPGCDAIEAAALGNDLIESVRRAFTLRPGIKVTIGVSVGIARAVPQMTVEALLAQADAALYQAKRSGKNRAVVSRAERAA